jgi:lambda family phage portal protein
MATSKQPWLDRAIGLFAPQRQLARTRARIATDQLLRVRHYEGASVGRRTQGWNRSGGDANAIHTGATLAYLRNAARDLARNNRLVGQALRTIANHTVGWGIVAKPQPATPRAAALWTQWAETTACDADGRDTFYGLQKLIMRGVAESGEMLVRRRIRRVEDGLPIPLQLQVLEPDFLDTTRTMPLPTGGRIVQGVEFDPLGRRVAYWLFPEHPGSTFTNSSMLLSPSNRIPASEILHIFSRTRAGQVRAATWLAALLLPAKDLDEYEDAQLMKQKIAACLAVITSDIDGSGTPLGTANDTDTTPGIDTIEPGAILNVPPGRNIEVVQPPSVAEYGAYVTAQDRKNAKGLGLSYEDYSGDYSNVNFSSARMARLEHYDNVYDWRWLLLIPQFCDPVWRWAMDAAAIMGLEQPPAAAWTAPPMPMIEPDKEGLAYARNVRIGAITWAEMVRERGYDPDTVLEEIKTWNQKLDDAGVVLDSDPRKLTQAGQLQSAGTSSAPPAHVS